MPLPQPHNAIVAVTLNCNARCTMCDIWQNDMHGEITPEVFARLPASLRDVNISGGEPFLRSDLPQILAAIKSTNPKARLVVSTNGFQPGKTRKMLPDLLAADRRLAVRVSIDGMNATGAALANVSTTPEISWTAPAIGVPTTYGLRIAQLTPSATGGTRRTFLFNLTLPGDLTRIRLPPGLLVPRADYFLRLTAYADPAPFDPARPSKSSGFPYASAQLLSSSFKTQ